MGYDRIRPSLDIESNLKSGIVRGGRSVGQGFQIGPEIDHGRQPLAGEVMMGAGDQPGAEGLVEEPVGVAFQDLHIEEPHASAGHAPGDRGPEAAADPFFVMVRMDIKLIELPRRRARCQPARPQVA